MSSSTTAQAPIRTTIPVRLDRLGWSPFHTRMVVAGLVAAYLTVSETWPIEIRSEAIAVFFAIGTIAGGVVEVLFGINAEGKSLEVITKPLTAVDAKPAPA